MASRRPFEMIELPIADMIQDRAKCRTLQDLLCFQRMPSVALVDFYLSTYFRVSDHRVCLLDEVVKVLSMSMAGGHLLQLRLAPLVLVNQRIMFQVRFQSKPYPSSHRHKPSLFEQLGEFQCFVTVLQ